MFTSRSFPAVLLALLALVGAASSTGCDSSPGAGGAGLRAAATRPPILLITLDTTRADHLGCYGKADARTPNLDSLAKTGILFEHAYTTVPITLPAHASIMTGNTPPRHGVRVNASFDLDPGCATLAEILKGAGYQTGAVVGAFPLISRFHLDRGFDFYDDEFPYAGTGPGRVRHHERKADQVVDLALSWLDARDVERPWFLWVHFFDPHDPYEPPPPFDRGDPKQLYAGEIAFTDQQIGRLLAGLGERGLREDTVVIVVGDHGEALGDHGEKTHSFFIYDETVRVPLVVAVPGKSPRREMRRVSIIDIMPTVVKDLLGLEAPTAHGTSLLAATSPAPPAYVETLLPSHEYGFAALFGLLAGEWKYIHVPIPELYKLSEDPAEAHNVARQNPDVVSSMRRRLEEYLAASQGRERSTAPPDDPKLRDMLATLGYARFGPAITPDGRAPRDPKEMLELYLRLKAATNLGKTGRLDEAIARLEEISAEFAGSFVYHLELGGFHYQRAAVAARRKQAAEVAQHPAEAKRHFLEVIEHRAEAKRHFLEVVEQRPDAVNAYLNLGAIEFSTKDSTKNYDRARAYFEKALDLDASKWEAYVSLCVCLLRTGGDAGRVVTLLQKALTLDLPPFEEKRARQLLQTVQDQLKGRG